MSYIQRKERQAMGFLAEAKASFLPIYEVENVLNRNLDLNLPVSDPFGNEDIINREVRKKILNLWGIYKQEQKYNPKQIDLKMYSAREISQILGETIKKREDRKAKSKYKR